MASKTRVPNKVQWALTDILAHCQSSREDWRHLVALAEKRLDPEMALYLARLRDHLSEIQHLAAEAAEGRYKETTAIRRHSAEQKKEQRGDSCLVT